MQGGGYARARQKRFHLISRLRARNAGGGYARARQKRFHLISRLRVRNARGGYARARQNFFGNGNFFFNALVQRSTTPKEVQRHEEVSGTFAEYAAARRLRADRAGAGRDEARAGTAGRCEREAAEPVRAGGGQAAGAARRAERGGAVGRLRKARLRQDGRGSL